MNRRIILFKPFSVYRLLLHPMLRCGNSKQASRAREACSYSSVRLAILSQFFDKQVQPIFTHLDPSRYPLALSWLSGEIIALYELTLCPTLFLPHQMVSFGGQADPVISHQLSLWYLWLLNASRNFCRHLLFPTSLLVKLW